MILGVPTLSRYDLLEELLDSAESGSLKPEMYIVVDNGGKYAPRHGMPIMLLRMEKNIGVAASWNLMLRFAHSNGRPIAISNDDIRFTSTTLEELDRGLAVPGTGVACGHGWSLFGQTEDCTRRVGYYDENFYPAYHEDCDYHWRMQVAGVRRTDVLSVPVHHEGSATLRKMPYPVPERDWFQRNQRYYVQKWGGMPGHEKFREPFDSHPPEGWRNERKSP